MAEAQAIIMPRFGQTVEECTLVNWLKKEGAVVAKGDILFEIETDKATLEVESFLEGTILKILVREQETVPVQTTVGFIGNPGDSIPEVKQPPKPAPTPKETPVKKSSQADTRRDQATFQPTSLEPAVPAGIQRRRTRLRPVVATARHAAVSSQPISPPSSTNRLKISPRAARLAREKLIDPAQITGTGPGGRVVEKDVAAYLESCNYDQLKISPSARKLAAKEKIDILSVSGTGTAGRIVVSDVKRAIAEKPKPMSKLRQVVAARLTHSFTTTPHFYATVAVDMTDLLALRAEMKEQGLVYSVTDFIMKALILSLGEFPDVNSTTDGKAILWHSKVHLGLAVSLETGLVVPVIRDADDLSMCDLHDRAATLAAKARDGKLLPDEMTGSTFTISNMGMMDVENFTAIINPGESAILAVSSTVKKAVVKEDKIIARSIMKMTLSADHRIIDGAVAVQFVNAIRNKLEDVELWKRTT